MIKSSLRFICLFYILVQSAFSCRAQKSNTVTFFKMCLECTGSDTDRVYGFRKTMFRSGNRDFLQFETPLAQLNYSVIKTDSSVVWIRDDQRTAHKYYSRSAQDSLVHPIFVETANAVSLQMHPQCLRPMWTQLPFELHLGISACTGKVVFDTTDGVYRKLWINLKTDTIREERRFVNQGRVDSIVVRYKGGFRQLFWFKYNSKNRMKKMIVKEFHPVKGGRKMVWKFTEQRLFDRFVVKKDVKWRDQKSKFAIHLSGDISLEELLQNPDEIYPIRTVPFTVNFDYWMDTTYSH